MALKKEVPVATQLFVAARDARMGPGHVDTDAMIGTGRTALAEEMFDDGITTDDEDYVEMAEYRLERVIRLKRVQPVFEVVEVS